MKVRVLSSQSLINILKAQLLKRITKLSKLRLRLTSTKFLFNIHSIISNNHF